MVCATPVPALLCLSWGHRCHSVRKGWGMAGGAFMEKKRIWEI